jgi:hypothetical protein
MELSCIPVGNIKSALMENPDSFSCSLAEGECASYEKVCEARGATLAHLNCCSGRNKIADERNTFTAHTCCVVQVVRFHAGHLLTIEQEWGSLAPYQLAQSCGTLPMDV